MASALDAAEAPSTGDLPRDVAERFAADQPIDDLLPSGSTSATREVSEQCNGAWPRRFDGSRVNAASRRTRSSMGPRRRCESGPTWVPRCFEWKRLSTLARVGMTALVGVAEGALQSAARQAIMTLDDPDGIRINAKEAIYEGILTGAVAGIGAGVFGAAGRGARKPLTERAKELQGLLGRRESAHKVVAIAETASGERIVAVSGARTPRVIRESVEEGGERLLAGTKGQHAEEVIAPHIRNPQDPVVELATGRGMCPEKCRPMVEELGGQVSDWVPSRHGELRPTRAVFTPPQ